MGTNFHTAFSNTAPKTSFTVASMGSPLSSLDMAISKLKNVSIGGGGTITYVKATGVLSWSATINIYFNSNAGLTVINTISAGNVTLTDAQFAYVDLNETTGTALTVTAASFPSGGAASNFIAYNRLVLAYRDTASDNLCSVYLHPNFNDPDKIIQTLIDGASITVDWSRGSTAVLTLARASTEFTFSGAYSGQRCVLILKQYASIGVVTFTSEVRACAGLASPPVITATDAKKDYLEYIYNGTDTKYDFVNLRQGF